MINNWQKTKRSWQAENVVASGSITPSGGEIGPVLTNAEKISVGFFNNSYSRTSAEVTHYLQLRPDGRWIPNGSDTFYKGHVTTIEHLAYAYKAVNEKPTSLELVVDVRRML